MRVAIVGAGARAPGSLATAFARGASAAGYDAHQVAARALVEGAYGLARLRTTSALSVLARAHYARLERELTVLRPDVVVVVRGRFLSRELVERLRHALGRPVINYYPDDPYWPEFTEPTIVAALPAYDEVVTWSPRVADELTSHGIANARVVRFGYDPETYYPPATRFDTEWDVALVGQYYRTRLRYAEALADRNLFVTGYGWASAVQGGPLERRVRNVPISGDETRRVYWRSLLGLNVLHDVNISAHNMRTFEVPASGTAMLATRTPDHEALFGEDGAFLVESPTEARAVVAAALRDPERVAEVARRGLERVAPHTYDARMRELLGPWEVRS